MNNYENEQIKNALKVLDLKPNFNYQELHNKKRSLLAINHPDKHPGEEEKYDKISKEINEAFYVLKNSLNEEKKKQEESKVNEFRSKFIKEINNISVKYSNYQNARNLCKTYLERIKKLTTLDELERQKKEFNSKIKVIKDSITFEEEKKNFKTKLTKLKNTPDIYIEEKNLAILFLEKLEAVYNLPALKELIKEYQEKTKELREDIEKRHLENLKNEFARELNNLKRVGFDKDILDVIDEIYEKIENIENTKELNDLRIEFNFKIERIKKYKLQLKKMKKLLFDNIEDISRKYKSREHAEVFNRYRKIVDENEIIEDLDNIREDLKKDIERINQLEKEKHEQFIVLKDKVKRACIYNFYKSTPNCSTKRILKSLEILKKILVILEIAEMDNFNTIIDVLENINYKNLDLDMSKLDFFILTKDSRIIIKDKETLSNLLKSNDYDDDFEEEYNEIKERRFIKDKILKDQYNYATNNNFQRVRESIEILKKVFTRLDEMNDLELLNNYNNYEKVDFKDMSVTKKAVKDLSFANNIYLRLKTGDICLLERIDENILVTPVSVNKGVSIIDEEKMEKDFITLREFFDNAYFTNGKEVYERINRYDTSRVLYTFERKPLYHYRSLLLDFYEPTYFNSEGYFEFTSSSSAFGWKVGEANIDMGNCYRFRNRELCEEELVKFIKKQIEYSKEQEETFDF